MLSPSDCIKSIQSAKHKKFDETIDLYFKLNINSKKVEQNIRDVMSLPHPILKKQRILVIDNDLSAQETEELGIDYYGAKDMIDKVFGGWIDFEVVISTPKMMPMVSKLGKILGPKGLMPNPKLGTVTSDIKKTVKEFKKGRMEYKNDSFGNLHISIGKISFNEDDILKNFHYVMDIVKNKKHSTIKGKFIKTLHLSSTMGKSFQCIIP